MATNYYQDPLGAPDYSAEGMPSLLSLSNLESIGRGSVAGLFDLPYMIEGMLKGDVDPRMPPNRRYVPSSEQVLATTPRMTQPTPQAGLLETVGGFMSPAPAAAVKPVAQAVAKGGKALGKAYLKEIDAAMMGERGGLLGAVTPQPMRLDVWHGSPHGPFRQFDPTKIGTGEGAQSYGYGHYLGEARGTGEEYAKNLANRVTSNQDRLNAHANAQRLANLSGDPKYAADDIRFVLNNEPNHPQKELLQNTLQFLESGDYAKPLKNKGFLYKVDLPDEQIAKMLNWDEPFSKQSENVQTAILKYWSDNPSLRHYGDPTKMTGEGIYGSIKAASLGPEGGARINLNPANQAAAMDLKHYGIPGIRYLDQGSRRPGVSSMTQSQIDARIDSLKADIASGLGNQKRMKEMLSSLEAERASHPELTSNFVVFPGNENLLTIKEINDQPASLLFPSP